MNILTNKLPEEVTINNAEVPINWDFRFSIEFTELMENAGNYKEKDLLKEALIIYYPTLNDFSIDDIDVLEEKMMWFYRCGKPEQPEGNYKRILSYDFDSGYISAAFLEQYQIDFQIVDKMHWWKFRSLFESFKEDTEIVKIMGYRGANTSKMAKEDKAFYNRMKKIHKLPDGTDTLSKEDKAFQEELTNALQSGGDVQAIMKKYGKG